MAFMCGEASARLCPDRVPRFDETTGQLRYYLHGCGLATYVCPQHEGTGGYEPCCDCGGWERDDPNYGRECTEAGCVPIRVDPAAIEAARAIVAPFVADALASGSLVVGPAGPTDAELLDLSMKTRGWWECPNTPQCRHAGVVHDVEDFDDLTPTCCADGCECGKKET